MSETWDYRWAFTILYDEIYTVNVKAPGSDVEFHLLSKTTLFIRILGKLDLYE